MKNIRLLISLLFFLYGTTHAINQEPLDILKSWPKVLDDIYYDAELEFEAKQASIDRATVELENKKSELSENVYLNEKNKLKRQQQELDEKRNDAKKLGQQVSTIGLEIVKNSFQGIIDTQKIEALNEAKLNEVFAQEEGRTERIKILLQNETLTKLVLAAGAGMGLYYAETLVHKYFEAKLGMPKLLRQSSRQGVFRSWFPWFYKKPLDQDEALSHIILAPEIQAKITTLAHATAAAQAKGLEYRNLLLYGPPGTGKTLIAQTIARSCGMDFAMMTGADFAQFKPGEDVKELHKVFDWAEHGKNGLILFIDEADAFLTDRKNGCSERRLNLISAYLSRVVTGSKKIMIILATNHPSHLDQAVRDRITEEVEIPLPGIEERTKMLQLYVDTHLKQQQKDGCILTVNSGINNEYIHDVAKKIDGFSGRAIYQLISTIRIEGCIADHEIVSKALFDRVVEDKIKQQQRKQEQKEHALL